MSLTIISKEQIDPELYRFRLDTEDIEPGEIIEDNGLLFEVISVIEAWEDYDNYAIDAIAKIRK